MPITKENAQEIIAKRKTKSGGRTASIELNTTANDEEIAEICKGAIYWYGRKPCKTDEEVEERIREFFQHTVDTGDFPTVEKFSLALGVTRKTVWEWENGSKGSERAHMIQEAKEVLAALDADLASKNKIPQVVYIFRSKNYHGLKDQQNIVVTPATAMGEDVDRQRLAETYIEALPSTDDIDV